MAGRAVILEELEKIVTERIREKPPGSYTAMLAEKGVSYVARKLGEEAIELIVEAVRGQRERVIEETADLLYHLIVLLALTKVRLEEVFKELEERRIGKS